MLRRITRTVWILSFVSFFNDCSSEMLYPIMPLYLQQVGFSVMVIGVLEGVAEAVAGFSKMYFGSYSDTCQRRLPFVQIGYLLSAVAKPLIGVAPWGWTIFMGRTFDRFGKGLRNGARDTLLADEAMDHNKGEIFGFHRSFDTLGAVIGPVVALLFLLHFPAHYRPLFFIAFIPSFLGILLTFWVREKKRVGRPVDPDHSFWSHFTYWKKANTAYKKLFTGLLIFAFCNGSDFFLILKLKELGYTAPQTILYYILFNMTFALLAFPIGRWADRIGLQRMLVLGLLVFAIVYAGLTFVASPFWVTVLFILYGMYYASSEGISKALISRICPPAERASALGFYQGWQSLALMLASWISGAVWYLFGAGAALLYTAVGALLTILYFVVLGFRARTQK